MSLSAAAITNVDSQTPLLSVRGLTVRMPGQQPAAAPIVQDVSFMLERGRTLGLVGESGSGKTTLARAILRLIPASQEEIRIDGVDIARAPEEALRGVRRRMQIVFQDPFSSLNPRRTVGQALAEPIRFHRLRPAAGVDARVAELLEQVGLSPDHVARYPHEFSGGQRQRIGIARALAVEPSLLICDEAVSALDVSVQAQILNLLQDLQARLELAYLFIAHNLAVVQQFCDQVAVLYRGRIVELAPTADLYARPGHPYTRDLLAAVPRATPAGSGLVERGMGARPILEMGQSGGGCAYAGRCTWVEPACHEGVPRLEPVGDSGHRVACFRARVVANQPMDTVPMGHSG